jgi:hypothetical protein
MADEIKTQRYRTSALFNCSDCDKNWEDHNTARQQAYNHARQTGHKVTREICTGYHYNL